MYVELYLKSNREWYTYDNVNLFDICYHKFPSGRNLKCLGLNLDDGTSITFCLSEIGGVCVENFKDERHPWNDDAKIIFVEDGQAYENRFLYG